MTRRNQWILVGGVVTVMAGVLYAAVRIAGDEVSPLNAGQRAPNFTAVTTDGEIVERSLADYKGHVVILNIWRTDCAPCEVEMPSFQRLHQEFRDRGLRIVAVSVDPPGSERRIRDFVNKYNLTFDILYDSAAVIQDVYQTRGYPESFVIGRDGIITRKVWGDEDWSSLPNRSLVAQLLGQPLPPADTAKAAVPSPRSAGS
jgi:peroxiredoxin